MILVFFLLFISVESKGGFFYAEPKFVQNYSNDYSDIVETFFYLQQTSKWTVRFNGEVHVKQHLGPMMGKLEILAWTGRTFRKLSGGPANDVNKKICAVDGIVRILQTLEPKSGFNVEECSFSPGNYTSSVDYDEHLHQVTDRFTYGPARVILTIGNLHDNKTYFGFMLQVDFVDLNLYKFIPKN